MGVYCFLSSDIMTNYIGIKYLNTKNITVFCDQKDTQMDKYFFDKYLIKHGFHKNKFINFNKESLKQLTKEDVLILPIVKHVLDIRVYQQVFDFDFKTYFVEPDGHIYDISKTELKQVSDDVNLTIKDFISQTGGRILHTNTNLFNEKPANELMFFLTEHLNVMMHIFKKIVPLKKDDTHDFGNESNPYAQLETNLLNQEENKLYLLALKILEKHHIVVLKQKNTFLSVKFLDLRYKEYFSKAGTWLEHYTHHMLSSFENVEDVNSSVMYVWDDQTGLVKNELDVMGVVNNQLLIISCKDTEKLVDDYFYELESHAENLMPDGTIKVIVTTAELGPHIIERAKFLDIDIVTFKSQDDFKIQMATVINEKI